MIQSLRQIKRRIRSIENTKKITRAMEMVSGAKLKRTENVLYASRPYFSKLDSILKNLLASIKDLSHPLLEERQEKQKIALCLITSDTGLCSTYNDNIIRLAEDFINRYGADKIRLITVGRKGFNYFKKRRLSISHTYIGFHGRFSSQVSDEIARTLTDIFLSKEADEVYIAYTHFVSALRYKPTMEKFLNIERAKDQGIEYILEPNLDRILMELVPRYVSTKMRLILLEAFTSEHSARMIAMKAATDNAEELIDSLTLLRNKARQAAITKEVIEVASAAEALKG